MKVFVDDELCVGCGMCADMCGEVFHLNEDLKSEVIAEPEPKLYDKIKECSDVCPVEAIKLEG